MRNTAQVVKSARETPTPLETHARPVSNNLTAGGPLAPRDPEREKTRGSGVEEARPVTTGTTPNVSRASDGIARDEASLRSSASLSGGASRGCPARPRDADVCCREKLPTNAPSSPRSRTPPRRPSPGRS